ncbi:Predicted DNA-binding protein, contains Ribbon-helix-helix (RHH) domain [Methylobacterium sp. 174MFSha1.1]|uniref:ribbon-helix-helix domain-containing protein n=1 Tax=Methylobacterium sp. 174MFSha1.1 TaxID=1502749 RepID=UPI0008F31B05|nr:Predicted DNA-binding protein, contains Ribbon-helix-helix (RHH) domain [Methylobacterium sp. 174MFSha1.1]
MSPEDGPPPGSLPEGGLLKRSLVIAGHRTSVSLEAAFWEALRRLALARGLSVQALVGRIDAERGEQNLSSAIRVFVLRAVWPGERAEHTVEQHSAGGLSDECSPPSSSRGSPQARTRDP